MASIFLISLIFILSFHLSLAKNASYVSKQTDLQTYIVRLRAPDTHILSDRQNRESWYTSFLSATKETGSKKSRVVHFYHHVFPGFAAKLTSEEVEALKKMKGFVSARPEKIRSLHTTHSPSFLGLQQNLGFWSDSNYGEGIIIGVLDTGIKPDHPSFGDKGMLPPPAKWRGTCEFPKCNNKLIGARYFVSENGTPLDENGHGTHTAGTAAGNFVEGANVFGNAYGTAVGIAPRAHLAVYKVCSKSGSCADGDILAGIDAAIGDGVDVLSLSLGAGSSPFHEDVTAIGAFSAMQRGIFVSASAGNEGPTQSSLSNEAPWILTVGASTTDRKIRATAVLGDNQEFDGESVFQPNDFPSEQLPLVYPGSNDNDFEAQFCNSSSLENYNIRGKIVLCMVSDTDSVAVGQNVKDAGGAGMILMNDEIQAYSITVEIHVLPVTHVSFADGQEIINYVNTLSVPTAAIIFKGTLIGDVHAPAVSYFSSRGPSLASPGILKPDIIGPGVNILAAWPFSVEDNPDATSTFNIISGTSMSCPHLSGVAALLKSVHSDWSPAVIKSAIMTTGYQVNLGNSPIEDETSQPADVFALGAGHVNPSQANDPGLVYDINPNDYIRYLCGLGYTNEQVSATVSRQVDCGTITPISEAQLNYPSFSVRLGTSLSSIQIVSRTVTNVGGANAWYYVQIVPPRGVAVAVVPPSLYFSQQNQQVTYEVTFTRFPGTDSGTFEGYLIWRSNRHFVRSPIVVELS